MYKQVTQGHGENQKPGEGVIAWKDLLLSGCRCRLPQNAAFPRLGSAKFPAGKHTRMGDSCRAFHTLSETLSIDLQAGCMCQNAIGGIFVIIASRHGCKLLMGCIQCKQVSAHILFSLTALVSDRADIQLLRDLLFSLHTLCKGARAAVGSTPLSSAAPLLTLCLKVQ